jgi:hypothetical protein
MTVKEILEQYDALNTAMKNMRERFAEAPKEDWQASLAWEAIEKASDELGRDFWNIAHDSKPKDFRHWREKYTDTPL